LRVTTSTNFDGAYYLAVIFAEEEVLGKRNLEEINFSGESIITSYNLFQNYPNPFNPSTTLKYQIPQNGFVTLKVYDILSKEVATLVNEVKTQGRYEATFDASSLASGVYLYRLNVNDYVDVKKMILLK